MESSLSDFRQEIVGCRRCPRLNGYCAEVARVKRRAYRDQEYWGRPVPSFGDADAKLLILGLAPGAHGANRTGRVFTGDSSGGFLYRVLHATGFASQPMSTSRDDGLKLINAYITAAARCAPPDNKPLPAELLNCREYLERELKILKPRAILALGKIGWDVYLGILKHEGTVMSYAAYPFAHGAEVDVPGSNTRLFGVYHPSQQNTSTGVVTPAMYAKVLARIRRFLAKPESTK